MAASLLHGNQVKGPWGNEQALKLNSSFQVPSYYLSEIREQPLLMKGVQGHFAGRARSSRGITHLGCSLGGFRGAFLVDGDVGAWSPGRVRFARGHRVRNAAVSSAVAADLFLRKRGGGDGRLDLLFLPGLSGDDDVRQLEGCWWLLLYLELDGVLAHVAG